MVDSTVASALAEILDGAEARDLESQTLEFKTVGRSRSDTLQRLSETAACFANAQGGTIIVGVADQSSGYDAFVGHTLDAARTARRIYELTEPALTTIVKDIAYASHHLLTITVPSSPEVHAVGGRSTERVGDACEPMSTQRIATVVADRRNDDWSGHDSHVPVTQAQPIALSIARSMLTRVADPATAAYGKRTDPDLLRSLGLTSPSGTLNNAGALLFSDDLDRGEQLAYIHRRTPSGALIVNEHLTGPLLPILERAGTRRRAVGSDLHQPPPGVSNSRSQTSRMPRSARRSSTPSCIVTTAVTARCRSSTPRRVSPSTRRDRS